MGPTANFVTNLAGKQVGTFGYLLGKNCIIIASAVLSRHTSVIDRETEHTKQDVSTLLLLLLQNLYSAQIQASSSQRRWRIATWGTWLAGVGKDTAFERTNG